MLYHLEDIEKIRNIEKEFSESGYTIFDISHWDSGTVYNKEMLSVLKMNIVEQPFKYIYSYEISNEIHAAVRQNLISKSNDDIYSVFFPSSTLAIVNIANFLQKYQLEKVCILQPSYFTVEPALRAFGINTESISVDFSENGFIIPIDKVLSGKYDAVWITSPIFCTSTYYSDQEVHKLQALLDEGKFLICDESLSVCEKNLRLKLSNCKNLITIHSPHKVISINAIKFSCILCNACYETFFEQWVDLFCGGLPLSSVVAIEHFLSSNYSICLKQHIKYTNNMKQHVTSLIRKDDFKVLPIHDLGQYMTIFYPGVSFVESKQIDFIKKIIANTHVSLLPGYIEGFYENMGFCFRINLSLNKTPLISSLHKVLKYLEKYYS